MKIKLSLSWVQGPVRPRSFKSEPCFALLADYAKRIGHFSTITLCGREALTGRNASSKLWILDHSQSAKEIASETLSTMLGALQTLSAKELVIAIGGADGFTKEELRTLRPDFLWSLGPMTLPHELAAVVAAEQVYRAFTIIRKLPYHAGH